MSTDEDFNMVIELIVEEEHEEKVDERIFIEKPANTMGLIKTSPYSFDLADGDTDEIISNIIYSRISKLLYQTMNYLKETGQTELKPSHLLHSLYLNDECVIYPYKLNHLD